MEINDYMKSLKASPQVTKYLPKVHAMLNKTDIAKSTQIYDFSEAYDNALKYLENERRTKNVIVPKEFMALARTIHFKGFVNSAYEYFRELYRLEQKKQQLKEEAIRRHMPMPPFIESEANILHAKAKEMSTKYAWIIFKLPKTRKSQSQEKYFYETLMFFCAKVLADGFPPEFEEELTKELNRLFRSNAFNSVERKQTLLHSIFNEPCKDETVDSFIQRVSTTTNTTKVARKVGRRDTYNEFKPKYIDHKSIIMMHYRSPLLSVIFPDHKFRARSKSKG